jgi:hypothetical protein
MERKILFDTLVSRAQEYPRNGTSDFKALADITNTEKVRRLAAVCSSFASTAFQCFLPDLRFSKAIPWKIVEKGTLNPGSSPPPSRDAHL